MPRPKAVFTCNRQKIGEAQWRENSQSPDDFCARIFPRIAGFFCRYPSERQVTVRISRRAAARSKLPLSPICDAAPSGERACCSAAMGRIRT